MLFSVFSNGLGDGVHCAFSKLAGYTRLGGAVHILKGRRDWNSRWADMKVMNKHKVLHVGWNSFMQ